MWNLEERQQNSQSIETVWRQPESLSNNIILEVVDVCIIYSDTSFGLGENGKVRDPEDSSNKEAHDNTGCKDTPPLRQVALSSLAYKLFDLLK